MRSRYATIVPLAVLNEVARHSVEWLVMAEDLPHRDNRVTIDASGRISTARTAVGMSAHAARLRRARRVLWAAGYDAVATQRFDISTNSHQCGTVVAGTDPARSVLDGWCRTHEVDNLWVVDGSFFPSSAR